MRKRILKELLPKFGLDNNISSSFDLIGDILILRKKPGIDIDVARVMSLAKELLNRFRYIKTVYLDVGGVIGEHRTRNLVFIAGEQKTRTVYREYGLEFVVDISHAYISPRLSFEHYRVSRLVSDNEIVVNMFAGIGAFSIFIAKFAKPSIVYSIDINPIAYELMIENIRLNKTEDKVKPILGDAAEITRTVLRNVSDRVLMPLPNLSERFYCSALIALRSKGYIHAYEFLHVNKDESKLQALLNGLHKIEALLESCGEKIYVKPISYRVVRSVGPRWIQGVFDLYVERTGS